MGKHLAQTTRSQYKHGENNLLSHVFSDSVSAGTSLSTHSAMTEVHRAILNWNKYLISSHNSTSSTCSMSNGLTDARWVLGETASVPLLSVSIGAVLEQESWELQFPFTITFLFPKQDLIARKLCLCVSHCIVPQIGSPPPLISSGVFSVGLSARGVWGDCFCLKSKPIYGLYQR